MAIEKITLEVKEVSALIGVSQTTIYAMVREGQIPFRKIRGRILFSREVIEAWVRGETA